MSLISDKKKTIIPNMIFKWTSCLKSLVICIVAWIFLYVLFTTFFFQGNTDTMNSDEKLRPKKEMHAATIQEDVGITTKTVVLPLKSYSMFRAIRERTYTEKLNLNSSTESTRREIIREVKELWYYLSTQLHQLEGTTTGEENKKIRNMLKLGAEHKNAILNRMERLSEYDGSRERRKSLSKTLSAVIQDRLNKLQNPIDCKSNKKVICRQTINCGFGCKFHYIVFCLMFAYAKQRTLILKSSALGYKNAGWDDVFFPVSNCSFNDDFNSATFWNGKQHENLEVVQLNVIGETPVEEFFPLAIPSEFSEQLISIHGNPFVWWAGQFLKFLWKPQEDLKSYIKNIIQRLKFHKPVVGFHVRRTDKIGTEASFHSVDEYMKYAEDYYMRLGMKENVPEHKIFIASDDPEVYKEAQKKYPKYSFLTNTEATQSAGTNQRSSKNSLYGIIVDIHLLSQCDYVVCTLSSQVCRIVYELMQTRDPDLELNLQSLDDIYFFAGQQSHVYEAILPHEGKTPNEISFKGGVIIHIHGNHWDGYSKGVVKGTEKAGLFPSLKAHDVIRIAKFPS